MRVLAPRSALAFVATCLLTSTLGLAAHAQDDGEEAGILLRGYGSVGYLPSFQNTDLNDHSLDGGQGLEANFGFSTGDMFTWLLGYQLAIGDDYDTHFFPVTMRMYDPWRLLPFFAPDAKLPFGLRTYTNMGFGFFFSQLSGSAVEHDDNKRASAWRLGGGVEIDLTDDVAGFIDAGYTSGVGSANSYEYGTVGVGLVYRWDL